MKHFVANQTEPESDCSPAERSLVDDSSSAVSQLVDRRVILVRSNDRNSPGTEGGAPSPGFEDGPITIRAANSCIEITQLGAREFEIGFRDCGDGTGFNFDTNDFVIANGFVKNFRQPLVRLISSDDSLIVSTTNGQVDVKVSDRVFSASQALPSRVLCAVGSCPEAGRAIGVVQVTRLESGDYQLNGCALAGEGATAASLSYSPDVYQDVPSAVAAMYAATLTAAFGSCGGNGL